MVLYLLTEIQAHLRNSDMRPVYPKITWSAHYYSSLQVLHYVLKILQSNASCQAQSGLPEVHNQENYAWLQHWPCYRHWNTITQLKICIHCHWAQRTPGSLWSRVQEQGIQRMGPAQEAVSFQWTCAAMYSSLWRATPWTPPLPCHPNQHTSKQQLLSNIFTKSVIQ